MIEKVREIIAAVKAPDQTVLPKIQNHLDNLTKPQGSLGRLEDLASQIALITGQIKPIIKKRAILTFAADHGVAQEGVSAYPSEVTPQMVMNMLGGGAAINQLARHINAELFVIDIGVNDPLEVGSENLIKRKVRAGTRNMVNEPAMTPEETAQALEIGVEVANIAIDQGANLLGTGEMGIANTTSASALMAALLPCDPLEITGRGTGIDDKTLENKIRVIEKALEVHKDCLADPFQTLAALGGLEIAGITGMILGAAARRVPVVVDGFISSAGALAAFRMCEQVRQYMIFSHLSAEAGHLKFFELINDKPVLDLGMRLGEGTGAALAMSLIEAAVETSNTMATFESAGVSEKND